MNSKKFQIISLATPWVHNSSYKLQFKNSTKVKILILEKFFLNVILHVPIDIHSTLVQMVGYLIVNVVFNHSFDHNLDFKVSKEKYEPIFDMYISIHFQ